MSNLDPVVRLFSPSSGAIKRNKAERVDRAAQIDFEKNDLLLRRMGGSTDPETLQIPKIGSSNKGLPGIASALHRIRINRRKDKSLKSARKRQAAAKPRKPRLTSSGTIALSRHLGILGKKRE